MTVAIIGGTGCQKIIKDGAIRREIKTPYGTAVLFEKTLGDDVLYLMLRHGEGHRLPPHSVNYRANIAALSLMGVTQAIGIYAVGSITDMVSPGDLGVINQFIDFTGGSRESTFHTGEETPVRHMPMERPYDEHLRAMILREANRLGIPLSSGGTYVCTNGPRLETVAEIAMFRLWGADYVGMTAATETILANEAGLRFAGLVYSINWAAGLDPRGLSFVADETADRIVDRLTLLAQAALLASREDHGNT